MTFLKNKWKLLVIILLSVLTLSFMASTIVVCYQNNKLATELETEKNKQTDTYDFYLTLGTMPTLYATLNAYTNKNPNTYMWFLRGNTISKQYSADYIHYFNSQSTTNANSAFDYMEIRNKVREIYTNNNKAKFNLYCDDARVRFIFDIFVSAGVDFEDLNVTLLSDGTGSYNIYANLTEDAYTAQADQWKNYMDTYLANRNDPEFTMFENFNGQALEMDKFIFYTSTFSNVKYWIQHPDFLVNTKSATLNKNRYAMNIVKKDPKAMYNSLDNATRDAYQKVVLANALVDSDTLQTLDDAKAYFDNKLGNRDKDVVLILGNRNYGLEHNKNFVDQTLQFYTPTVDSADNTQVKFKGRTYTITAGDTTLVVDGKTYTIGEVSVYLFFKGHPSFPANNDLRAYFDSHNIEILPHRTPVETLFWMYNTKVGGYNSTSFLSCDQGQAEFFYGELTGAVKQMQDLGFYDGAVTFTEG